MSDASESGDDRKAVRVSPLDTKTTITLGLFLATVGLLVGGGIWAGTMNTKLDFVLKGIEKLNDLDARVRVLEDARHK